MKKLLVYMLVTLVNFSINVAIYNYSFNRQATPHLHEEQRVESAILMFKTTIPAYFVAAVLTALTFYFAAKWLRSKN